MNKKKIFLVGLILSSIWGCSKNYPATGKYDGSAIESKLVAQYAKVYALDSKKFGGWKSIQDEYAEINSDQESLLKLRGEFAKSELVRNRFSKDPFLASKQFDFDALLSEKTQTIKNKASDLGKQIDNLQNHIEHYQDKKKGEATAQLAIEDKKANLENQKTELEKTYIRLKEQASQIFSQFDPKEFGERKPLSETVLAGKVFEYSTHKDPRVSCYDQIAGKSKYSLKRYGSYIFAAPVTIADKSYCPYFEMLGRNSDDKSSLRSKLTENDTNIIQLASLAYVNFKKKRGEINDAIRSVPRDNPELASQAKSFSWSDERKLKGLIKQQNDISAMKDKLESTGIDQIKTNLLASLEKNIEGSSTAFYLFKSRRGADKCFIYPA